MRLGSAGCVARPHIVALGRTGSGKLRQVCPPSLERSTCARLARGGLAAPGEQHARIVGLDRDAAGIGQRPFRLHADRRPRLAQIRAPEHLAVRAREHARWARPRDRHMRGCRDRASPVSTRVHVSPPSRLRKTPSISTPAQTVCGSSGSTSDAGDERRADGALRRDGDGEPLPLPSAVARAIDGRRPRPGKEGVRVDRIDGERPDRRAGRPACRSAPRRPRRRDSRTDRCRRRGHGAAGSPGSDRQRLDAAVQRERRAMPHPRLAGIRAVPHAPAGRPQIDVVVHRDLPFLGLPPATISTRWSP